MDYKKKYKLKYLINNIKLKNSKKKIHIKYAFK